MRTKYVVEYWNTSSDSLCRKGFLDYSAALEFQFRMKNKGHNNVRIISK